MMEPSKIFDLVKEGWDFIFMPLAILTGLFSITWILAKEWFLSCLTTIWITIRTAAINSDTQAALSLLGIDKLAPIVALISVVFLLYILQHFVLFIGDLIPFGQISTLSVEQFFHFVDIGFAAHLWAKFPNIENAYDLPSVMHDATNMMTKKEMLPIDNYWIDEMGKAGQWISIIKFFMIWIFIILFFAKNKKQKKWLKNTVGLFIILSIGMVFSIYQNIYAAEQAYYVEINIAKSIFYLDDSPKEPKIIDKYKEQLSSKMNDTEHNNSYWWEMTLPLKAAFCMSTWQSNFYPAVRLPFSNRSCGDSG